VGRVDRAGSTGGRSSSGRSGNHGRSQSVSLGMSLSGEVGRLSSDGSCCVRVDGLGSEGVGLGDCLLGEGGGSVDCVGSGGFGRVEEVGCDCQLKSVSTREM
jgi:hypothetical protein